MEGFLLKFSCRINSVSLVKYDAVSVLVLQPYLP